MIDFEFKEQWLHPYCGILILTEDCNLQCRYCFVEQHPKFMTLDTAKVIVDYCVNNLHWWKENAGMPKSAQSDFFFFGGEPMLMFDSIIKPLVIWAKDKYKDEINFSITSNLTLYNKEVIDFFYEYNIPTLFSCDGDRKTQEFNRPAKNHQSSFDMVMKNIPYLLSKFPNTTFRSTIYEPTVAETYNNYIFAESLGFKQINMIPDIHHEWKDENIEILEQEINKIFCHRINQLCAGEPRMKHSFFNFQQYQVVEDIIQSYTDEHNYDFKPKLYNALPRCGLGIEACSINPDGDIHGCQEHGSHGDDIFYLGNIFTGGVEKEKSLKLVEFYMNCEKNIPESMSNEECQNCIRKNICRPVHNCISALYELNNSFNKYPKVHCKYLQSIFFNCLVELEFLTVLESNSLDEVLNKYGIMKKEET